MELGKAKIEIEYNVAYNQSDALQSGLLSPYGYQSSDYNISYPRSNNDIYSALCILSYCVDSS